MRWPLVPLGEVANVVRQGVDPKAMSVGTRYVGLENINSDGGFSDAARVDSSDLASTKLAFTANHVLFGKLRPYLRKIVRPDFDGICSTDIIPIAPSKRLDRDYLFHFLRTDELIARATSMASGANLPRISPRHLVEFEIPLPPLDEQRRIAAILDQADALRRKRHRSVQVIGNLQKSLFDSFVEASTSSKKVRLSEVCRRVTDGTHQAPDWVESGVPFIFVSNVRNGQISLATEKFVSKETYVALTRYAPIEVGDVLYTAVGSYGHSAVVKTQEPFLFQRHVAHIKPDHEKVRPAFLAQMLESPALKRQADQAAKGVAQKTVTLADLKSFEMSLPNLAKQDEFVGRTGEIDQLNTIQLGHLAKLDALFASIQHRVFEGGL